jgi:hypothetical protein
MIKLKSLLFESKILIPRRTPKEREKTLIAEHYRIIQRYIKDGCQGNLDLRNSPIKILPDNLTHVGGHLSLYDSKIEDLNNLEKVDRSLILSVCKNLKSFGKLREVKESIFFSKTLLTKVPDFIVNVNGDLGLNELEIEDLNNVERVNGTLYLSYTSNLKSLGNLKYVRGNLYLEKSNILNIISVSDIKEKIDIGGLIF